MSFSFLYLHLIDRIANNIFEAPKRFKFMDELTQRTFSLHFETVELKSLMYEYYNDFQMTFGPLNKIFFRKNESSEGTLVGELYKRIIRIAKQDSDALLELTITRLVMNGFTGLTARLKVEELLSGLKEAI